MTTPIEADLAAITTEATGKTDQVQHGLYLALETTLLQTLRHNATTPNAGQQLIASQGSNLLNLLPGFASIEAHGLAHRIKVRERSSIDIGIREAKIIFKNYFAELNHDQTGIGSSKDISSLTQAKLTHLLSAVISEEPIRGENLRVLQVLAFGGVDAALEEMARATTTQDFDARKRALRFMLTWLTRSPIILALKTREEAGQGSRSAKATEPILKRATERGFGTQSDLRAGFTGALGDYVTSRDVNPPKNPQESLMAQRLLAANQLRLLASPTPENMQVL